MKKIVITGGAGFIGTKLAEELISKGYKVVVLDIVESRIENRNLESIVIDTEKQIDSKILDGAYGVINLAGTNIGKKWNKNIKDSIYNSRINTTRNIVHAMRNASERPSVLVSASAVGIYGDGKDNPIYENSPYGNDFLAGVAKDWEAEAKNILDRDVRVVLVRTAHVLGKGGILGALRPIFEKHVGGYFGNGSQYMPWVHWKDIVGIYVFALENKGLSGPVNTAAGEPVTQKKFMKSYAYAGGYWPVWSIPRFIAKVVLGEFGLSLFSSQKVYSAKLIESGYTYLYSDIGVAMKDVNENT